MLFKCFNLMETSLDSKVPVEYCVVGRDEVFIGETLKACKEEVLKTFPKAEFKENCGWVFVGEEEELLDPKIQKLIEDSNAVPKTPEIPSDPRSKGKL